MSIGTIRKEGDALDNVVCAMKVFEEHAGFIRSVIHFNVKNEALSDDLFQDFFLLLISKPMPEEIQNVRGFINRVLSDQIKDAFRRIDRYQAKIQRYGECRKYIVECSPENGIIEVEEIERMFALIRRCLPPSEAIAVTLRYRNDCDTAEVAEKMGITSRSVSRYVSAGIKKLRQFFGVHKR